MDQTENNNENRIAQEGKRDNANETGRILKDNELNAVTGGNNSENLYSMKEFLRRIECICKTPVPGNNGRCLFCGHVIEGVAGKNESGGGIAPAAK